MKINNKDYLKRILPIIVVLVFAIGSLAVSAMEGGGIFPERIAAEESLSENQPSDALANGIELDSVEDVEFSEEESVNEASTDGTPSDSVAEPVELGTDYVEEATEVSTEEPVQEATLTDGSSDKAADFFEWEPGGNTITIKENAPGGLKAIAKLKKGAIVAYIGIEKGGLPKVYVTFTAEQFGGKPGTQ